MDQFVYLIPHCTKCKKCYACDGWSWLSYSPSFF